MNDAPGTTALPESLLNPLLRRLDWSIFLPASAPWRSACATGGALRQGLGLVSTEILALDAAPPGRCDLAVVQALDGATLRAVQAALRPGGWCCAEWRAAFPGGGVGAQRRLGAAGFEAVACYWPWPAPERARFWLPLDAPGAMRHFWATRQTAAGLAGRARKAARRAAWYAAARIGLVGPVYAIGRKPLSPTAEPDRSLAEFLRDGWEGWGLGPAPPRVSCLLLTGGGRSISKCVVLAFAEPDPRPRLAVKCPRTPQAAEGLAREAAVLERLHARAAGGISGLPRPLFHTGPGGRMAIGQTALPGCLLQDRLRPDTARSLALQVTDWLAEFATRAASPIRSDWRDRILHPALARFAAGFGEVIAPGALSRVQAALERLGPLPAVPEQRDCSPWNLLLGEDGGLIVLDWESAEPDGVPGLDLLYFLTYLALQLEGIPFQTASPRLRTTYRRSLDPATSLGALRAECLTRYAARLGLDPSALAQLAALAWAIHAGSDHRSLTADLGGRPSAELLRGSVFLALWEEELRHARSIAGRDAGLG